MIKLLYRTPLSIAINAGRTCWDSHSKGGCYSTPTDDIVEEDKAFLNRILNKHKHRSVAEHIRVTFVTEYETENYFKSNKYSFIAEDLVDGKTYISTNLRVLLEWHDECPESSTKYTEKLGDAIQFLFQE